jgi:hypothetical protein
MEMINIVRKNLMFLIFAPLIGVLLGSYLSTFNLHDRVAFWLRPVVQMKGDVVAGPTDSYVILHIYGSKLRGEECVYKGLQAFGERAVGPAVDLRIARVGIPEDGATKPRGTYDIGLWRVWPVDGIDTVKVYVTHQCGERFVATKIAEVEL